MKYSGFTYSIYRKLPISVQNCIVTMVGKKRWKYETSKQFQSRLKKLVDLQWSSEVSIYEYQKKRLIEILLAARKTEFYSELLPSKNEIHLNPFDVLKSVPVLSKNEIRDNFKRFINPLFKQKLIYHTTGGTTGTPLQVVWSQESFDIDRALIWRHRFETGCTFGKEWRGMFGGHLIVPREQTTPPFWRVNRKAKQVYFSGYHISKKTAPYYLDAFKKYNIRVLEGYPSLFYSLAYFLDQYGESYDMKGMYFGSEPLLSFQRKLIEQVFGCYVWGYYGLTELVLSASEFECKNSFHENWENCVLEILDIHGSPIQDDTIGELVGTSLSNYAFPLLRYRTGDMAHFINGDCRCGRHSRRISRIKTRREDLLLMPDGSMLSSTALTIPIGNAKHILETQLFQATRNELEIRIVTDPEYTDLDGKRLIKEISEIVPASITIVLKQVNEIPRTKAGKYRFCISEVESSNNQDLIH